MLNLAILIIFPFAMVYAACSDLVSMTIANRISIALVVSFPVLALAMGMPLGDISLHFGVGLLTLLVTFGLFAAGWIGGGDAKLMAATALWFGPSTELVEYLLLGSVFGGLLTIGLILSRGMLAPVTGVDFIDRLLDRDTGIPYGIALGAAGLTVYSNSGWMDTALNGLARSPF
ncbi:A24 family peptidase [Aurantimonas marianensis]|uniref:Prepilin peptidase n=1 Tax=Aurantimonas marianensis TaxID=2920428 RepID=A0A9X2KJT8_9HYPH|nr:prepilin peptidase [Aurantimonas marianensis]MCP3056997.1 prepilin peptidase [Aurantimonas marianensis]